LFLTFRESEAQTDPFSPEYVVDKENSNLEVLTLKDLFYGKGLPASMAEMELIEQMREKRAFDNALPPTSDEACFTLRRKLMEE
jgi:Cilia- and flagella-associated protein 91